MSDPDPLQPQHTRPLPEYLARLAEVKASGVLTVSAEGVRRDIRVLHGEIRSVASSAEDEMLGTWLVLRDRISEDARALALLRQGMDEKVPLGQILLEQGQIDVATLDRELEALSLLIVKRAAAQRRARCELRPGADERAPDVLPHLTTTEFLLTAARAFPDMDAKRAVVGGQDRFLMPTEGLPVLVGELRLTPAEGFLLSRLDQGRTLRSLTALCSMGEDETVATAYTLIVARLLKGGIAPTADANRARRGDAARVVDIDRLTDEQRQERQRTQQRADELRQLDHFAVLGLKPGAGADEVRAAHDSIARRFAPERTNEPHMADLGEVLAAIRDRAEEAYDVLREPVSRARYETILDSVEAERRAAASGHAERRPKDDRARAELVAANFKRADELIREGEIYLAIRLLEQACALDPRPEEMLKLARLMLRNPLWVNRALQVMRRVIDLDPSHVNAWLELAEFWHRRNDPERQRKAVERALGVDPDHARANRMYLDLVGEKELARLRRRIQLTKRT